MRLLREFFEKLFRAVGAQRSLSGFVCEGCDLRELLHFGSSAPIVFRNPRPSPALVIERQRMGMTDSS